MTSLILLVIGYENSVCMLLCIYEYVLKMGKCKIETCSKGFGDVKE